MKETQVHRSLRKSPGEGNANQLHYSCLENSMERGAWPTLVHGIVDSDMTEHTQTHTHELLYSSMLTSTFHDVMNEFFF